MNKMQLQIEAFHRKFGHVIGTTPAISRPELRVNLIREEAKETCDMIEAGDLAGAVDGICDLLYVAIGAAVEFGIDLEPFFDEVHRTNMLKEGGATREDGKLLKPPGWQPPKIAEELERQRRTRPHLRPIEHGLGAHMPWATFVDYCGAGTFVDSDGFAELAMAEAVSEVSVSPDMIRAGYIPPDWATHVVWYNR